MSSRVAVPVALPPFGKGEAGERILHVVVETTRGRRNKLAYESGRPRRKQF